MNRIFLLSASGLLLAALCGGASADPQQTAAAPAVLVRVDSVLNAPKDQTQQVELTLIEKDGTERSRTLSMWQKGDETRTVKFVAPADVRNIAFLSLPDDVMYLYLPAFKKVRRIASHVKNQRFAGTDFTYDDMGTIKYSEDYDARFQEETPESPQDQENPAPPQDPESLVLVLTPKEGVEKDYGKLRMWVGKANSYPTRTEY